VLAFPEQEAKLQDALSRSQAPSPSDRVGGAKALVSQPARPATRRGPSSTKSDAVVTIRFRVHGGDWQRTLA